MTRTDFFPPSSPPDYFSEALFIQIKPVVNGLPNALMEIGTTDRAEEIILLLQTLSFLYTKASLRSIV